jgi:multiple sugar transport system permease protein
VAVLPAEPSTLTRSEPPRRRSHRKPLASTAYHVLLIAITFAYVFPALWAVSMSLRTDENMFKADQLIPNPITFEHYANLFATMPELWRYFGNTLVIAVLGTAGTLLSSSLAGYALARFRFPGRGPLLLTLLLTLMVPVQATLIPQYVVFRELGWMDSPYPIIVPMLFGTAFASFFFRQFFLSLPRELEGAAAVDGAGPWRTFFSVIAPLAGPAYLAMGLLTFVGLWNSFYVNSIYLTSQENWVLTQALQSLVGRYSTQYGEIMAGVTIVSLPVIVAYVIFQRWIVRGIAMTGLAN